LNQLEISFSTLGCPDWTLPQAIDLAGRAGYDGIELRFVEGEDSLWKLPSFQSGQLAETKRHITDSGLAICCVDTSCRFDSSNQNERDRWIVEGERMAELAGQLRAPGIRVFGDRIQPGTTRDSTRQWIADSLTTLSQKLAHTGVEIWLETHGDFATSSEVMSILSTCPEIGVVWDSASAFIENEERPLDSGMALRTAIRHVHVKDLCEKSGEWSPALTGEGDFPLEEVGTVMNKINYRGFLSFEWEKKWHPEIEPPEVAIPHFADWFRSNWERITTQPVSSISKGGAHS